MAKIPIYNSESRLTTEAPSVRVSPQVFGQEGRALQDVGKVVQETADVFHKANQTAEYTKAQADATKALYEMRLEYENDTDYKTMSERYQKRLQEIKESVLSNVGDPVVKNTLDLELDNDSAIEMIKVSQASRKRMIDDTKANIVYSIDNIAKMYSMETNPAKKQDLYSRAVSILDSNAESGIIDKETAAKEKVKLGDKFDKQQALDDMKADPAGMLDLLKSGYYKNLDPETKKEVENAAIKLSRQQKKDAKIAIKEQNEKTFNEGVVRLIQENLDLEWIEQQTATGMLDGKGALALRTKLLAADKGKADDSAYAAAVDMIAMAETPDQIDAARAYVVKNNLSKELYTKQLLEDDQGKKYSLADLVASNMGEGDTLPTPAWKTALDALKIFGIGNGLGTPAIASMTMAFLNKITEGSGVTGAYAATEAAQTIMRNQALKTNPNMALAQKDGTVMVDSAGNKAIVYPDGTIKPLPKTIVEDEESDMPDYDTEDIENEDNNE